MAPTPRRCTSWHGYSYLPELGWGEINLFVTASSFVLAASFALLLWNVLYSLRRGLAAGPNPWGAGTLEWASASPPRPYNFAQIPVVTHREPLWAEQGRPLPAASGLRVGSRELVVTTLADGKADLRQSSPDPSIWPFLASLSVGFTLLGSVFTPWAVVWGSPPIAVTLIGWFWPKGNPEDEE